MKVFLLDKFYWNFNKIINSLGSFSDISSVPRQLRETKQFCCDGGMAGCRLSVEGISNGSWDPPPLQSTIWSWPGPKLALRSLAPPSNPNIQQLKNVN